MKVKAGDTVIYSESVATLAARANSDTIGWSLAKKHNYKLYPVVKKSAVYSKLLKELFAK